MHGCDYTLNGGVKLGLVLEQCSVCLPGDDVCKGVVTAFYVDYVNSSAR